MNIADIFIRRPIMTSLIMVAIFIFGVVSYRLLPVNDLPNVDFPTIQVNANLPGANPDTMAAAVATPLENQLSTIAGVDSMTSTNGVGSTRITLQFNLDRNIDAAAQDVQASISLATRSLPKNMPTPPSFRKVNPADQPVLYLALSSPTLPLSAVSEYAQTLIAQRISTISGVAQVNVQGSQKFAVRAQLDPKALASRQVGIDEVATAIGEANVNLPTGVLDGAKQAFTIEANGQMFKAAAFRQMVVAYRDGSPIRLGEVGQVIDSVEDTKTAGWYNNTRAIILTIQRQPGTNTIEVVDNVKKLLPTFRSQMPASVDLNVLYDRSILIRESMQDVKYTLILTIVLVILVIFLFLRNLSATIIPSLALPMSIVGTFSVMHLLGFSINNITMMALTLAVGFVVDDAIVMLENIVRYMEKGASAMEAAFKGSKEIGFTIISMTISLVAVFIPVLFMGGILGRLLHEFALTISVAILVSCFVSLSLTPMLCSRFLKPPATKEHGRLYLVMERFLDGMLHLYASSLKQVLHYRRTTMVVTILITLVTGWLFTVIPMGFLPTEDTGRLNADTETAQGTSFAEMKLHQEAVAAIIAKDPNVDGFMSSIGGGGGTNTGRFFMRLKPRKERKLSADEIIQELRPKLAKVAGISTFLKNVPSIQIGGTSSKSQYQFTLQGQDTDELYRAAGELEARLRSQSELLDVTSDLQIRNPQVHVDINRDKVAALGLSVMQVEDALAYAYGSRQVSSIFASTNQYQVILELDPLFQGDPAALSMLYIHAKTGQLVPLETIATISKSIGPLSVNHLGQLPAVTISFNLRPGVALGDGMKLVDQLAGATLPASVTSSFQGTAQAFKSSFSGLWMLLVIAIFVIYVVLGVLYESYIHPITILSGLPAAGFGALITLMIFHSDLNIYGFVGIIMLLGIVKKNAIMMIDFALEAERTEGKRPLDAIYEGAIVRFRPIMMTTMAAMMGTLPIAMGLGAGGESRRPLGLAVVGGLLTSQLLTLYITPVVYYYMDAFLTKVRPRKAALATGVTTAVLIAAFVFGSPTPLWAEAPPINLTLNDAIRFAFERNLDLKVELYNPAMAEADIRRNLGIYDPLLTADASHSRVTNPDSVTLIPQKIDSSSFSIGASQLLPTGATLGAIASGGWTRNSVDYFSNAVRFFVSQPLLKNFGRETTELNIAVSRTGKEGSLDRFRIRLSDTVAQVRTDYFKLYNLREALEVKKASLALTNKILDETRGSVKAGVLPAMEILNAEFGSATREKEVIDAERAVKDQMDVLRLSLQLDKTSDIVIADPPTRDDYPVSEEEALAQALANRPELAAQRMTLKIEDLQQRVAKNRILPELSASANVGFGGYDQRYNQTLEKTVSADYPAWGVGVQLSFPIGNRLAKNDYIKSRLLREQAEIQLQSLEAGIANDVKAAIRLLQSSFKQIDVTSRGRVYAEDRLKAFEKKNAAGLSTTKDVLDVENDLATAKGNQIQALVDYNNAITGYWRATGKLLDQEGIILSERQADPLYERAK